MILTGDYVEKLQIKELKTAKIDFNMNEDKKRMAILGCGSITLIIAAAAAIITFLFSLIKMLL